MNSFYMGHLICVASAMVGGLLLMAVHYRLRRQFRAALIAEIMGLVANHRHNLENPENKYWVPAQPKAAPYPDPPDEVAREIYGIFLANGCLK